jgi:hypothetical protein
VAEAVMRSGRAPWMTLSMLMLARVTMDGNMLMTFDCQTRCIFCWIESFWAGTTFSECATCSLLAANSWRELLSTNDAAIVLFVFLPACHLKPLSQKTQFWEDCH